MARGDRRWGTWALLGIAFGIRLAGGLWLGHFREPFPWEYEILADNLLQGGGYSIEHLGITYRAHLLPGYPLLCAAVYALTGHSHAVLIVLQCAIAALACLQIRRIGQLAFPDDPRVAEVGAWLVALHPGLIHFSSRLHSLTLTLFLFLWALWSWLAFLRSPNRRHALHAGFSSGLALLTRGTLFLFIALMVGCSLRKIPRPRWNLLGIVGLTMALVVAPWLVRNAVLLHHFPVFITTSGQSFWQGNNPRSSGSSRLPDGSSALSALPEELARQLPRDEIGQNRFFYREAHRFIRTHPIQALRLFGRKWLYFWWRSPQTGMLYSPSLTRWYQRYYIVVAALALAGLAGCVRTGLTAPQWILIGYCLTIALHQSLHYVDGRHRWPVEPILLLLAAQGALGLWSAAVTARIVPGNAARPRR